LLVIHSGQLNYHQMVDPATTGRGTGRVGMWPSNWDPLGSQGRTRPFAFAPLDRLRSVLVTSIRRACFSIELEQLISSVMNRIKSHRLVVMRFWISLVLILAACGVERQRVILVAVFDPSVVGDL